MEREQSGRVEHAGRHWNFGQLTGLILGVVIVWQFSPALGRAQPNPDHATLFTANVDGSDARPLVAIEGKVWHGSPAYSRDGKFIAFDASPQPYGGPPARLYSYSLADQRKTITDLGPGACPSWSPADKKIAFFVQDGNPGGEKPGVYVMNADGSDRKWLSEGEKPRWAPAGEQILFMSRHEGFPSLYVVEGEKRRRILFEKYDNVTSGSWSPDGKRVAYIGMRNKNTELGVISAGGKEEPAKIRWKGWIGWIPAWSPDGRQIAIWMVNERRQQRLSLVDVDTLGPPVEIPGQEFTTFNSDPAWSPDGKRIAFSSDRTKP